MQVLPLLIALLAVSGVVLFNTQTLQQADNENLTVFKAYQSWKAKYSMNTNGIDEYRFAQFQQNYALIQEHNNAGNSKLRLGLTQFAAMSNEEYRQTMLLQTRVERREEGVQFNSTLTGAEPTELNWVEKGAVYDTQDQGHCGSCWAFSAIGGLQGLRQLVTGQLELLSAQQITSCSPSDTLDTPSSHSGCMGGEARYAFNYTNKAGIVLGSDYPYVSGTSGEDAPCRFGDRDDEPTKVPGAVFTNTGAEITHDGKTFQGAGFVKSNDPSAMKAAIQVQPLNIAVDAGGIGFQLYDGGIIDSLCGTSLNHAILLVGYNETGEQPYWLVQNSWGASWGGIGGFAKIIIEDGDGMCGINMQVDYPTYEGFN